MKNLIVAEKSSVAADIAKALGDFKKAGGYFERDDLIVVGAVGHLVWLQSMTPQAIKDAYNFDAAACRSESAAKSEK